MLRAITCFHKISVGSMLRAAAYFHMRSSVLLCLYAFLLSYSSMCLAEDTLKAGEMISENGSTLVSVGQIFELGFFFPPGNSTIYLGIWYHGLEPKTVVWVANRDNPVTGFKGVFQIAEDGNLKVVDNDGKDYWSSGLEGSASANRTVKLMDSGNLVLIDSQSNLNLWQSFEHPTDTFLPGMKLDGNLRLTCWRSTGDPGSGNYTFKQGPTGGGSYIISRNASQLYWESGISGEINSEAIPGTVVYLLTNFTIKSARSGNEISLSDYNNTRLLMNSTGQIQMVKREESSSEWSVRWEEPQNSCKIYNFCGNFSSCNPNNRYICRCLPGFTPRSPEIDGGYFHNDQGCVRKSATCGGSTSFVNLVKMKMSNPSKKLQVVNERECRLECLKLCPQCQACSYVPTDRSSSNTCWLWTQDLTTLEEEYQNSGGNLSTRVDISDIALTPGTCVPCGANIIPYPLSTGPNCGDPMYSGFNCDYSIGQVNFVSQGVSYRVAAINPTGEIFFIKAKNLYCNSSISRDENEQINISFPYNVSTECYGEGEVGITWPQPPEPICSKSNDCRGWPHSTCNVKENRCLCNTNYVWNSSILSCTLQFQENTPLSGTKEPQPTTEGHSKISLSLIIVITLISIIFLICTIISVYLWRKRMAHKQDRGKIQRIRGHFYDSERQVKDLIDLEGLEEKDTEGIGVPYFDFESILEATANFSDANKLGRGGYGPVYKGMFPGSQVIAVKRLSSVSTQGLQEFKNEVVLIAKLQHRNLVRLRGYCIKGDEKILLYEYMPNKSLDTFIFDPTQSVLLDWQMRINIILGIARGLLYLHQDSRLRVIHRDLKTSNILLDGEMEPKISDFGLARIFGNKETEANTERVVGTYGYMSPEYALNGLFSIKSDVFSFGVVLLEIISGRKNTGLYQSKQISSLLGFAWRLWTENKLMDLMDPSLREICSENQFIRCAHISLLCVQDEPVDRPTMSNVVTMLDNETTTLPIPKQPTFFMKRGLSSTASSSSKPEITAQFDTTYGEGR